MKRVLILSMLLTPMTVFAAYKTYDPYKDSKYLDKAIVGPCKAEHQEVDKLENDFKMNIDKMSNADADKAGNALNEAQRVRWICIEKQLNKNNLTLNLDQLFKQNGLD